MMDGVLSTIARMRRSLMPERALGLDALGDVVADADQRRRACRRVRGITWPWESSIALRAVRPHDPLLEGERLERLDRALRSSAQTRSRSSGCRRAHEVVDRPGELARLDP